MPSSVGSGDTGSPHITVQRAIDALNDGNSKPAKQHLASIGVRPDGPELNADFWGQALAALWEVVGRQTSWHAVKPDRLDAYVAVSVWRQISKQRRRERCSPVETPMCEDPEVFIEAQLRSEPR